MYDDIAEDKTAEQSRVPTKTLVLTSTAAYQLVFQIPGMTLKRTGNPFTDFLCLVKAKVSGESRSVETKDHSSK